MCHPLLLGLKYTRCPCFTPLRREFVDCLLPTCTSSLCHPYDCVGYLCTCTRQWEGEELKVLGWEEGVCENCWGGNPRAFSPQTIYHKRLLSPALHESSAKYSTMTRPLPPVPLSRSGSSSSSGAGGVAPTPYHPPALAQTGFRPSSQRSRLPPTPTQTQQSRNGNVSRASGRSYASLADYGYTARPPAPPPPRVQRQLPSASLSATLAAVGRAGSRLRGIKEELESVSSELRSYRHAGEEEGYVYEGEYDMRPMTRQRREFPYVREAVERSESSGSTVSGWERR